MDKAAQDVKYVGFWMRVLATLIDTLVLSLVLSPLLSAITPELDVDPARLAEDPVALEAAIDQVSRAMLLQLPLFALAILLFWRWRSATPGKMLIGAVIADAVTLQAPSVRQCLIRYLGYFISAFPLLLGLIWVGFDSRKQGWHDKLAGTVVIRKTA